MTAPQTFPRLIYVTHQDSLPEGVSLLERIEKNLSLGVRGIYLREKKLPESVFRDLAHAAHALCRRYQATLILPADASCAEELPESFLQCGRNSLTLEEAKATENGKRVLGYSAHGRSESRDAAAQGAHYLFFSPVFRTTSKPQAQTHGLERLREVCSQTKIPVYALGGITQANFQSALTAGAYGLAGISIFQEGAVEANCREMLASWR